MAETYAARTAYRDKTVAGQYDQRRFGSWRGRLGDWLDKRALKLALADLPQSGGIILDVPSGTGRITSYIAKAGYRVLGADIAVEMLTVAQNHSTGPSIPCGYVQADATCLPFRDRAFTCATAIRFMGHVPSATRVQVLLQMARVSQGHVIADYCVSHPITDWRRRVERMLAARRLGFKKSWTWQSIPKPTLEYEFRAANLQPVRWFAKLRFLSDAWVVLLAHMDAKLGASSADTRD